MLKYRGMLRPERYEVLAMLQLWTLLWLSKQLGPRELEEAAGAKVNPNRIQLQPVVPSKSWIIIILLTPQYKQRATWSRGKLQTTWPTTSKSKKDLSKTRARKTIQIGKMKKRNCCMVQHSHCTRRSRQSSQPSSAAAMKTCSKILESSWSERQQLGRCGLGGFCVFLLFGFCLGKVPGEIKFHIFWFWEGLWSARRGEGGNLCLCVGLDPGNHFWLRSSCVSCVVAWSVNGWRVPWRASNFSCVGKGLEKKISTRHPKPPRCENFAAQAFVAD